MLENEVKTVGSPLQGAGFEMLEPCAGIPNEVRLLAESKNDAQLNVKIACTVLKGESGRKPRDLPGLKYIK